MALSLTQQMKDVLEQILTQAAAENKGTGEFYLHEILKVQAGGSSSVLDQLYFYARAQGYDLAANQISSDNQLAQQIYARGVARGGTVGQLLAKAGPSDYQVGWVDQTLVEGIPAGGSSGQVLTKTGPSDYEADWADQAAGAGVPTGGTTGQILAKVDDTDYNTTWIAAPSGGGGGTSSVLYPKHSSLSIGDVGKLLMVDGGLAKVYMQDAATTGTKEQWTIQVNQPTTAGTPTQGYGTFYFTGNPTIPTPVQAYCQIKIQTTSLNVVAGDWVQFGTDVDGVTTFTFSDNPALPTDVAVGATGNDSIANLYAALQAYQWANPNMFVFTTYDGTPPSDHSMRIRVTAGSAFPGTTANLVLKGGESANLYIIGLNAPGYFFNGSDGNPVTISLGGLNPPYGPPQSLSFVAQSGGPSQVTIGATIADTVTNLIAAINAAIDPSVLVPSQPDGTRVRVTAGTSFPGSQANGMLGISSSSPTIQVEDVGGAQGEFMNGMDGIPTHIQLTEEMAVSVDILAGVQYQPGQTVYDDAVAIAAAIQGALQTGWDPLTVSPGGLITLTRTDNSAYLVTISYNDVPQGALTITQITVGTPDVPKRAVKVPLGRLTGFDGSNAMIDPAFLTNFVLSGSVSENQTVVPSDNGKVEASTGINGNAIGKSMMAAVDGASILVKRIDVS